MTDLIEFGRGLVRSGLYAWQPVVITNWYINAIKRWFRNANDSEENIEHLSAAIRIRDIMKYNTGKWKPSWFLIYGDKIPQYQLDKMSLDYIFDDKNILDGLTYIGRGKFSDRAFYKELIEELEHPTNPNHIVHEFRRAAIKLQSVDNF